MKQVLLRKGRISVEDVPEPARNPNSILVEVSRSLISPGTEMSSVHQSGGSLLEKVQQKPGVVLKALDSIRVRGLKKTWVQIQQDLDQSQALGYSCTGTVVAVGRDVTSFVVGDRVACAGAQIANHAEVISVPPLLAVRVPQNISDSSASFVTLGSIALQGVRRADVKLGETVAVIGLGLIGQLTVQLLLAAGCRVAGLDLDAVRVDRAKKFGLNLGTTNFEELKKFLSDSTAGQGADATLITASTSSSDPIQWAFEGTRKKGRVVLVGAVGMNLKRSPFYEKEQDFLISSSYGPGRYDPTYEQQGRDYPYAYVRWTENRNMASFLDLIAQKKIAVEELIDGEIPVAQAEEAYRRLEEDSKRPLALVLTYEREKKEFSSVSMGATAAAAPIGGRVRLGILGLGSFTKSMHLPNLRDLTERVEITGVCTGHSASAQSLARQLKAPLAATDPEIFLSDSRIDAVLIGTRHDSHARLAKLALQRGKHIYLEKPLALHRDELSDLDRTVRSLSTAPVFMVGFNRRFAPLSVALRNALNTRRSPLVMTYRVNAGAIPPDHWSQTTEGGGRLRGEACHMVDLFRYLVGHPLKEVQVGAVVPSGSSTLRPDENFSASFNYEDGSLATLVYTSQGSPDLPKEFLDVNWDGQSATLNDFKDLRFFGAPGGESARQDKGHKAALETFLTAVRTGQSFPIPWDQLVETTEACIRLDDEVWGRMP